MKKKHEGPNSLITRRTVNHTGQIAVEKDALENASPATKSNEGNETLLIGEQQKTEIVAQAPTLKAGNLMEKIVDQDNLNRAYQRVAANKGASGIDGMSTDELKSWLKAKKEELIKELFDETYQPNPVRRVNIPKPNGGTESWEYRQLLTDLSNKRYCKYSLRSLIQHSQNRATGSGQTAVLIRRCSRQENT